MNFLFVKPRKLKPRYLLLLKLLEKKKCSFIPNRNGDGDVQ